MSNGVRVRIGSADRLLNTGRHEYVIRYRTTRQIGFFADYDELYWNATGTGWTFADRSGRGAHHLARRRAVPADRALYRAAGRARAGRRDRRAAPGLHRVPHHEAAAAAQRAHGRRRLAEGRGDAARRGAAGGVAAGGQQGAGRRRHRARAGHRATTSSPGRGSAAIRRRARSFRCSARRPGCRPPPCAMSTGWASTIKAFTAALIELGVNGHIKLIDRGKSTQIERRRRRQGDRSSGTGVGGEAVRGLALAAAHSDQS